MLQLLVAGRGDMQRQVSVLHISLLRKARATSGRAPPW